MPACPLGVHQRAIHLGVSSEECTLRGTLSASEPGHSVHQSQDLWFSAIRAGACDRPSLTPRAQAAVHALAARPEVDSFALVLPSPVTEGDLGELLAVLGTKLTSLEVQQVRCRAAAALAVCSI